MKSNLISQELNLVSQIIVKENIIINVNEGFLELSGYLEEEIIGKNIYDVCRKYLRLTGNIKKMSSEIESFLFTKSLESREVIITLKQEGDLKVFTFTEKTSSRIEEKFPYIHSLKSSKTQGVAVFAITPQIVLVNSNQTFIDFLDAPYNNKENSIGKCINEIITGWEGSPSEKIWEKVLNKGEYIYIDEYKYDRFERGVTYWKATLMPIFENNVMKYAIEVTEEVTETVLNRQRIKEQAKKIELQNVQLEAAMKMKDEFLYLITHEFRTPMAIVSSALQAIDMLYKNELTPNVIRHISTIKQNTNRQLRLVNNLLDITRIKSGNINLNMKIYDIVFLTKSIVSSVEMFAKQRYVNITFKSSVPVINTLLDEQQYERILLNLLANALKFTPREKNIHVLVFMKKLEDKTMVCISVKDEGIGIPIDKQKIIFERFGQADTSLSRQAEGTGLGLHLVKLLVNALKGEIILESEVDRGSTFTIMLPLIEVRGVDEAATAWKIENKLVSSNDRLIQSASIEFADIYL